MKRMESHSLSSSKTLSIKHATLLLATWVLTGGLLTFARITHPAFGIQGDLPVHYHISRSFERSFSEGEMWPRWAGLLDGGRGNALFTFYPPFSYLLITAIMKLLGSDALTSLKVISALALIVAQGASYILARRFFNRRQSLICSLTYVLLPAYPLIGLHRAFIANAVALSLAPISLLGASLLLSGERRARGLAIFAIGFSALVLTHAITTYLCAVVIGLMALVYLPQVGWRGIARLVGAGIVTLALTAFFLWPQWVEAGWVQIGLQTVQQDYHNYFLFANSPDGSRYRRGWTDINYIASVITIAQTSLALLLGLMCLKILYPKKQSARPTAIARLGILIAVFGLIISLPISETLWRYTPGFKFIQFPWRFQPFVALGCGLLAATACEAWPTLNRKLRVSVSAFLTWNVIVCAIFTIMLARLGGTIMTRAETNELLTAPGVKPISIEERQRLVNEENMKYTYYTANEFYFRPRGADSNLYPPSQGPGGLSIISGRGHVVSQKLHNAHREFLIESEEPARARIETYHYPHWVARLDGREINITAEQGSGLMLIDLPAGKSRLTLDYEVRQASQRIAGMISLAAWGAFLIWIITRAVVRLRHPVKPGLKVGDEFN